MGITNYSVYTVGRGLRFSRNDRTFEIIKLLIICHAKIKQKKAKASAAEMISLNPIVRAQVCNRPVGITGEIMPYNSVTISQSERALYRLQTQAI